MLHFKVWKKTFTDEFFISIQFLFKVLIILKEKIIRLWCADNYAFSSFSLQRYIEHFIQISAILNGYEIFINNLVTFWFLKACWRY